MRIALSGLVDGKTQRHWQMTVHYCFFLVLLLHSDDQVLCWSILSRSTRRGRSSLIQHHACPQGVFPPSVKSPPDVEMRSGIDHVITVLRRATARVDPNRRLSSEYASLALILAVRRRLSPAL